MPKRKGFNFWSYAEGLDRGSREVQKLLRKDSLPQCKFCGSTDVLRYGYGLYTGKQRYFCKKCKRKFAPNEALPSMRTPIKQIADTLSLFYGGMSLKEIRRHFEQHYGSVPSRSTIYRHITCFTKIAIDKAHQYIPNVGNTWITDETVLKIGGDKVWFWDIIDIKTRFLLASHMSLTRTTHDARVLLARAARRTEKPQRW